MRRSYILLQTFLILLLVAAIAPQQRLYAQESPSLKPLLPAPADEFTPEAPPLFLWVTIPASSAPAQYRLRIVAVKQGQNDADAMERNQPLLERILADPLYRYAQTDPALAQQPSAARFAWRVEALSATGKTLPGNAASSDIRSFTITSKGTNDPDCDESRSALVRALEQCRAKSCQTEENNLTTTATALLEAQDNLTMAKAAALAAQTLFDERQRSQVDRQRQTEQSKTAAIELRAQLKDYTQRFLDRLVGGPDIVFIDEQPKKRMGSLTIGEMKIYFEGSGPRINTAQGFQPFSYALTALRDDADYRKLDAALTENTRRLAELETGAPAAAKSLSDAEAAIPTASEEVEHAEDQLEKAKHNDEEAKEAEARCAREKNELCAGILQLATRYDQCAAMLARRREVRRELAIAHVTVDSIAAMVPATDSMIAGAERRIRRGEAWGATSDQALTMLTGAGDAAQQAHATIDAAMKQLTDASAQLGGTTFDDAKRSINEARTAAGATPSLIDRVREGVAQGVKIQEQRENARAEEITKAIASRQPRTALIDFIARNGNDRKIGAVAEAMKTLDMRLTDAIVIIRQDAPSQSGIDRISDDLGSNLRTLRDALRPIAGVQPAVQESLASFDAIAGKLEGIATSRQEINERTGALAGIVVQTDRAVAVLTSAATTGTLFSQYSERLSSDYRTMIDTLKSRVGEHDAAIIESAVNDRDCGSLAGTIAGGKAVEQLCNDRLKRLEQEIDLVKDEKRRRLRDDFCQLHLIKAQLCVLEQLRRD
jgi:hypothetical protein